MITFTLTAGLTLAPLAYIGPGPGLTMLAALAGMLATLAVALWAVASWPFRAMMRRRRESRSGPGAGEQSNG